MICETCRHPNLKTDSWSLNLQTTFSPRTLARRPPLWLLVLVMGCGGLPITIISPALQAIAADFQADNALVQLLLSGYFSAVALSQLVYGPLSDRYGRKVPLALGLALYAIGGVMGVLAMSMEWLLAARVLQGLGGAASPSIVRAIINDAYERSEAAAAFGAVTAVMAIVPIFGFVSGGWISEVFGWRGAMLIIAVIGAVTLVMVGFFLQETNLTPLEQLKTAKLAREYRLLIVNPAFLTFALVSSCSTGIFFSFIGFLPYEYARLGVGMGETGFWFVITPLGYMLGNLGTRQFVHRIGLERLILIGSLISLLASSALLGVSQFPDRTPLMIAIPCMVFGVSGGLVIPNGTMGAIAIAKQLGGSASGITGAMQMGFGVLGGSLVAAVGGYDHVAMGLLVLLGFAVVAVGASLLTLRVKSARAA
ncbi:MAG: MFS transporter [Deltaproteobacteria bacterium]|nr:MFS transporter [Deltaproteobacteria bacterium]